MSSKNHDPSDDDDDNTDLAEFLDIEYEDPDEESPATEPSPTVQPDAIAIQSPGHTEKDEVLFRAFQFGTNGQVIAEVESTFALELLAANWCGIMHTYRLAWGGAHARA